MTWGSSEGNQRSFFKGFHMILLTFVGSIWDPSGSHVGLFILFLKIWDPRVMTSGGGGDSGVVTDVKSRPL